MEKMRTLVMIVILHLIITIAETKDDFTFGDMITIDRERCGITFQHYAIYVGKETFEGKKDDEDIFEFAGKTRRNSGCVFGKLNRADTYNKFNYLDGQFTVGNKMEITDRIKEKRENCTKYNALSNNCEHLATYVRYREPLSLQLGQDAELLCMNDSKYNTLQIMNKVTLQYNQRKRFGASKTPAEKKKCLSESADL